MTGVIGRLVEYQGMLLLMMVMMMMVVVFDDDDDGGGDHHGEEDDEDENEGEGEGEDDDGGDDDGDDDDDDVDVDVCTSSFKGYLRQLIFPLIWHCTLVLDALDLWYMLHWCMLNALYTCDISIYKSDHS